MSEQQQQNGQEHGEAVVETTVEAGPAKGAGTSGTLLEDRHLAVFNFGGQEVRVAGTRESPFFCVGDVCAALDLGSSPNAAIANHPEDEKGMETFQTPGGPQKMASVNEAGLYRLIFRSYKPKAEEFRRWVFREVLPALRNTGHYGMPGRAGEAMDIEGRVTTFLRITEALVKLGVRPVYAGDRALRWLPVLMAGHLLPSAADRAMDEAEQLFTAVAERAGTAVVTVRLEELVVTARELGLLEEYTTGSRRGVSTKMGLGLRHLSGAVLETNNGQWQVRRRSNSSEWVLRRTADARPAPPAA